VIKGHKHLRDCAYIGDNSSEEEDELMGQDYVPQKKETDRKQPHLNENSQSGIKIITPFLS